ncbi:hypothetical protein BTJ40_14425 [Microbulbifer sp. A4B17]|uniref:hypothetical protein n=1 Tax=Microbulbifer sp. A4B17 TaxID=359370 RepID=UPI000D52BD88|nr:hypothetical protein [Microbulbifer sp. A4B17]AWF81924.1 hypothetical protein BTJ40_14425 [Microbulbifer sp. A4B17]
MSTNYYKAPKASLESKALTQRSTISFFTALKATSITCIILPIIIAIFSLPGASTLQIINGVVPMLIFYLITSVISLIAIMTYGRLIKHFLLKLQIYNSATMLLGGALPSIILYLIGTVTSESGFFALAIIIALYAIPTAFLCHYFLAKSNKIKGNK